MNPNHHRQPPPQSLEQEFQAALASLNQFHQTSPGQLNGPLPPALTAGLSPPVATALQAYHHKQLQLRQQQHHQQQQQLQHQQQHQQSQQSFGLQGPSQPLPFYQNPQITANVPLNRFAQTQRTAPPLLPGTGPMPSGFANLTSDQVRSLLTDTTSNLSNSHPGTTPFNPSLIAGSRLPSNQQNLNQHIMPTAPSLLPNEQNTLIAHINAAKQGRSSNDTIELLYRKIGVDLFRSAGLGHLLDSAGNLLLTQQGAQNSQQVGQMSRPSDLPSHPLGPASSITTQAQSAQISGPSSGPYAPALSSSASASNTSQSHPSHTTSTPHSRPPSQLQSVQALNHAQLLHQQSLPHSAHNLQQSHQPLQLQSQQQSQLIHLQQQQQPQPQQQQSQQPQAQSQIHNRPPLSQPNHPFNPVEIDEAALADIKRQIHIIHQLVSQVNHLQRCLNENVLNPNDPQSHQRPMSAEERSVVEQELLKSRYAHRNLNAAFKQLIEKHGGSENLQLLIKSNPLSGALVNSTNGLHVPQQPRPQSSNAHQVPGVQSHPQILSLPVHQSHLRNQHQTQHLSGLAPGQQQPQELHQSSSHHTFQQNPKQVYQQSTQQALTPRQTAPSSFPSSLTPQQQPRQPSQGVFSSPINPSAATSNSAENLARFPNHQLQHSNTFRTGSPRQALPGSTQPPRPPSALQSSTYPSTSPNLTQGSLPNNNSFHQPSMFNIGSFLNGFNSEKFIAATRDSFARKGALWNGPPVFRGKELDLFKLFSICICAGGFERVTATGSWGHVAFKMDIGLNPSDSNDIQSAAKDICEIYRVFCLDFEHMFFAAVQKQKQEHNKRNQPQSVGHSPSQVPNQHASQAQTPQPNTTPQIQFQQADHNLGEPRSQQGLPDGQLLSSQQNNQSENIDKDLIATSQPPLLHFQGSSQVQQHDFNGNQSLPIPRDLISQKAAQTHVDNRPSALPQSRTASNEAIIAMSDDQLRELQFPEETIIKIRQIRAQNQSKLLPSNPPSSLPPPTSQPRPAPGWFSAGLLGSNSVAEDGIQKFGNDGGTIPTRSSLTGISQSQMNEVAPILENIKAECMVPAQTLLSNYQQTNIQELTALDKEQYKNRMEDIAAMFESVYQRLPEFLVHNKRHDVVRHVIVNAMAFRLAHNAFRKNEYCLAPTEMLSMRNKVEVMRTFFSTQSKTSHSSPQLRPHSQPPFQQQSLQLPSQGQQQEQQSAQLQSQLPLPQFPSQLHQQSPAQSNDLLNPTSAQAVPPSGVSHAPHFSEHLRQGLRVEDLKPPPKRLKTGPGNTLVTSPERPPTARVPSPTAPELYNSQQSADASGFQHGHDSGSPGANNSKSPISKGSTKRNQSSRSASNRGGRKSSTQIARSAPKPSHQIMAEVKAELAAAKAKEESEKLEQSQAPKAGTPSAPQPETQESLSETPLGSSVAPMPDSASAQPDVSNAPLPLSVTLSSKPQTNTVQTEKPPQMLVEDLLKEFWSDSFSSGVQGSTSTNTADEDGWRGITADLRLPIGIEPDDETARARENELLGSWLLDEEFVRPKRSPGPGEMSSIDMMYVGPTMASLFQAASPTAPNSSKGEYKTRSGADKTQATVEPKDGLGLTRWRRESMSDFLCDATQSIFGGQDESSPSVTGESKARPGSSGQKCTTGTTTDTPEFSPSKLSNDSTPESVCSTDGINPKRLVNINPMNKDTVQTHGSHDGTCYSNVEDDDTLLMYMMGFDDESTIGMAAVSTNGLQSKSNSASRLRVREGSGGFTGLSSHSALSDSFWDRPFATSANNRHINESDLIEADGKVNQLSSSGGISGAVGQTMLKNPIGGVVIETGENQDAITVK